MDRRRYLAGVAAGAVGALAGCFAASDPGGRPSPGDDGETLTFARDGSDHLRAGGSRWRTLTGTAVDGPHEGATLERANDVSPTFWFAWLDFHPETTVYTG